MGHRIPLVGSRQVFVYRWGRNPSLWTGKPTAEQALTLLRDSARDLKPPEGGWEIGLGKRTPSGAKQVAKGDVLVFYAGRKFGLCSGVYGIAVARGYAETKGAGAPWFDQDIPGWRLPLAWLPMSRHLADHPRVGDAEVFAPNGPQATLLRLTKIPGAVRRLIEAAIAGQKYPAPPTPLTKSVKRQTASDIDRIKELPDEEQRVVIRKIRQVVRNALFRGAVLQTWFRNGNPPVCAACECGISIGVGTHEAEIAHVVDKWAKGKDQIRNGLPLCGTHHWAFDKELWGIDPTSMKIVVRKEWRSNPLLKKIHGVKIIRPKARGGVKPLASEELKVRWKRFLEASR